MQQFRQRRTQLRLLTARSAVSHSVSSQWPVRASFSKTDSFEEQVRYKALRTLLIRQ